MDIVFLIAPWIGYLCFGFLLLTAFPLAIWFLIVRIWEFRL